MLSPIFPTQSPPLGALPQNSLRRNRRSGFSLLEVVVAMFILTMMAAGTISGLIQTQKLAASNLAQAFAEVTAQSVIEQLVAQPYAILSVAGTTSIMIKLPGLDGSNRIAMDDFELPWAATDTEYTDIGTPDPTKGILVDAAYIRESNTIRPERYMRMRMNLQRDITAVDTDRRVFFTLRYQWAIPDRGSAGNLVYFSGILRTARSSASSF